MELKYYLPIIAVVAVIGVVGYQEVYSTAMDPAYSVDTMDVYQSSSTSLGTGTAICTGVGISGGGTCSGTLDHGATYRFEFTVSNVGAANGSPNNAEFRSTVGSLDVLGNIATGDLGGAGCGEPGAENTDWVDTVTGTRVDWDAGTTCTINNTGGDINTEYFVIATVGADACDGTATATFFISDGSFSDESGTITFNCAPAGTDPAYTVTSLDVYESESTSLGTGNAICVSVSLTSASECVGILQVGHSYRVEVTVTEDNGADGTPTTLDIDSAVGDFDLAGNVVAGQITDSGCSTNTDWTESIVSADIRATSGTGCTINSSSAEFWIVLRIHSDAGGAVQPTVTFTISDGTITDSSTTTTFTVNNILG